MKKLLQIILFMLLVALVCNVNAQGFITTWKTDNPGTSNDDQITIPTNGSYTYDYNIYWEDVNDPTTNGTASNITGDHTITFPAVGSYQVEITGTFPAIYFNNTGDSKKIISIDQWGSNVWKAMYAAFKGCWNVENNATDFPNLSNVLSMYQMFNDARSFDGDIGSWDVSNVTNMTALFSGATVFNGNINEWHVSNVTTMFEMFKNAVNFNQDLDEWNVSKVEVMYGMFSNAKAFNGNISTWEVNNVTNMTNMFSSAESFDGDISKWNVTNVNSMSNIFNSAGLSRGNYDRLLIKWSQLSLSMDVVFNAGSSNYSIFSEPARQKIIDDYNWFFYDGGLAPIPEEEYFITTWDIPVGHNLVIPTGGGANISDYNCAIDWGDGSELEIFTGDDPDPSHVYANAGTYTIKIAGTFPWLNINNSVDAPKLQTIEQWGSIEWETMEGTFLGCTNITSNAIDTPNLSNVLSMERMFYSASSFNGNISDWDVSSVTDMSYMFYNATSFNQDLNNWDVSLVSDMSGMFNGASVFNGDISQWNVSSVAHFYYMFFNATSFNQDLSNWDVQTLEPLDRMFYGASSFNSDLEDWNVSGVTSMYEVFRGASSFNGDIDDWDVSNVTTMENMFRGATVFNRNLNNWDVSKVTDFSGMFWSASAFNSDLSKWNLSSATLIPNMFQAASSFNADLSGWDISNVTTMENMFNFAGFSTGNYDKLLNAWSALTLQNGVSFHAGSSTYSSIGSISRQSIIDNYGWTITDGGLTQSPAFEATPTAFLEENTVIAYDVNANDGNGGATDANLTYSITGGADQAAFSIDASTGVISFVNTPPDYEAAPADADGDNYYELEVTAEDIDTNTTTQAITIKIINANDNIPAITSQATVNVDENETTVLTVAATDDDAEAVFTFSLSGGADQAFFSIDTGTGELSFLSAPDFENPEDANADNGYEVQVKVSDGINEVTQDIVITVTDANDNSPVITSQATANVAENSTSAVTVTATDADAGSMLSYSLSGGADQSLFSIDANAGALSFNAAPDFENPGDANADNGYEVQVKVSDGVNEVTQDLLITVTNVNEVPIVANAISDQNLDEGFVTQAVDLTNVFNDADGDALNYTSISSNEGVVTVAITDNMLTLTEVGVGTSTITVTANDGKGGEVSDVFTVNVNAAGNNAPTVSNALSDQSLDEGFGTKDIDVTNVFTDSDGDALSITAGSADEGVVTTAISGNTLTLTEVGVGTTTITVTANDGKGGEVSDVLTVNVNAAGNNAPTVSNALSDQSLDEGFGTKDIDVTNVFTDSDGDALSITAGSADEGVVTTAISGNTLTLTEVGVGTSTITVTANDGKGGEVSDVFTVNVNADVNSAPTVSNALSDQSLDEGFGTQEIDLTSVFTDSDGDVLSITAGSADEAVVATAISGNTLTLTEVGVGTSTITVTANDGKGGSVNDVFGVTINEVLGLEEEEIVLVYPNPVNGMLTIKVPENTIKIGLYNALGQNVRATAPVAGSDTIEMNVKDLGAGMYTLIIETNERQISKNVLKK